MPTQHTLFPADTNAAPPREHRKLTTADIDKVRHIEGFPIATDEAIIALSDPPHYTACPNPFLADFIAKHGTPYDEATDDYHREPFAADVSEGKNDPIYNAHSYHTKVPHKAIMRYIMHYTNPGDVVYDGFCGTGMTGVAAQLCGDRAAVESLGYRVERDGTIYEGAQAISKLGVRKAVLSDLSPAATFIAYNYNTPVDVAAFEREAKRILDEVEAECGWMYETNHTDRRKGRINYTVWSDVFVCSNCGGEIVFWEAAVDHENKTLKEKFPCPTCNAIQTKRRAERATETLFDISLNKVIHQAKRIPVVINYSIDGKRFDKTPETEDLTIIERAKEATNTDWFPRNRMPEGEEGRRNDEKGTTHAHHFYTVRNLIVLAAIWGKIARVNAIPIRSKLRFAFTAMLRSASRMASIAFSYYFHGGGGFVNAGTKGTLYTSSTNPEINVMQTFATRIASSVLGGKFEPGSVIIQTSSASKQEDLPNTVDYIFVDPPFGSNLIYSELNFLWESWLNVETNTVPEAVVHRREQSNRKSLDDYSRLLFTSFRSMFSMLKPGRWLTVEFHNTQNAVWNIIQETISRAGFVIADVRTLDKKHASFQQVTATNSAQQDLVISAYKPRVGFEQAFERLKGTEDGAWQFAREHLSNIPVFVETKGKAEVISERMPYLLFDRMVAFHLQRGATVPLSAIEFYVGLRQRFPERDGMHFLEIQAAEYDQKRSAVGDIEQFTFYVSDEKSSIQWLRQLLSGGPQTYQQIQPRFLQELQQNRTEMLPELRDLLEQNFLQDDQGRWYIPDPSKQVDLEKLRRRELLREYATYAGGRGKLKSVRSEAVRAGFEEAYRQQDYSAILAVAARLPEAVLREDSTILTYYDLAQMEAEG